jgi:hypothetical protein
MSPKLYYEKSGFSMEDSVRIHDLDSHDYQDYRDINIELEYNVYLKIGIPGVDRDIRDSQYCQDV